MLKTAGVPFVHSECNASLLLQRNRAALVHLGGCQQRRSHRSVSLLRSSLSSGVSQARKVNICVATVPLVGFEDVAARLGALYPDQLALHSLVVLQQEPLGVCTAFDFLPLNPTSPLVVSRLLSGGSVPGELRVRQLRGLPRHRCWLVATSSPEAVDSAKAFQRTYDPQLRLFSNDCRTHTNALLLQLTGQANMLAMLPQLRRQL